MNVINEIQQMQKELDEIMNMTNDEMYIRLRVMKDENCCIEEEIDEEDDEYWNDYEEDMIIESKKEKIWMN